MRKDRQNPHEPVLPPATEAIDTPPLELEGDRDACAYWTATVPTLRRVGLVSDLESGSLLALCRFWSRLVQAERRIEIEGPVIVGPSGPKVNPAVTVANEAFSHCLKLWQELGMTPSGRSKMVTLVKKDPPKASKWAGIL